MRSILTAQKQIAARAGLTERDVQPFITGAADVALELHGAAPVVNPETLHSFDVLKDRCAIITGVEFSAVPVSSDAEFATPNTLADFAARGPSIGWLNKVKVSIEEGQNTLLKKYPSSVYHGSALLVLCQPGQTVIIKCFRNLEGEAEDISNWKVCTTVRGFLLPASARDAFSSGNTILL